jgi:hypothetical protein
MSLHEDVKAALAEQPAEGRDAATAALALTYAAAIDNGGDLAKVGPALLAVLEALHMSPRARHAAKKAATDDKPSVNPIDQLAQRRAGKSHPEAVDAAAQGS